MCSNLNTLPRLAASLPSRLETFLLRDDQAHCAVCHRGTDLTATPEHQLKIWAQPGPVKGAKNTHAAIRNALARHQWPDAVRYRTDLQGSYRNNTHLRRQSDVDVVVELTSLLIRDGSLLPDSQQRLLKRTCPEPECGRRRFRRDVLRAITAGSGESRVREGKKTLKLVMESRRRILVSAIEHKCVLAAARALEGHERFAVDTGPVDREEFNDLNALESMVDESVFVVSVMAVNNEVGIVQHLPSIAELFARYEVLFHCDAAQAPSITTTLPQFGQFLTGNRFAEGKARKLSSAWAGCYEGDSISLPCDPSL